MHENLNYFFLCSIDAFVESRYMMFIKYAAVHLQQLGLKKQMPDFESNQPAIDKKELPAIKSEPEDANKGNTYFHYV